MTPAIAAARLATRLEERFGDDEFESWEDVAGFCVGYLWSSIPQKTIFRAHDHARRKAT